MIGFTGSMDLICFDSNVFPSVVPSGLYKGDAWVVVYSGSSGM